MQEEEVDQPLIQCLIDFVVDAEDDGKELMEPMFTDWFPVRLSEMKELLIYRTQRNGAVDGYD